MIHSSVNHFDLKKDKEILLKISKYMKITPHIFMSAALNVFI